MIEKSLVTHSRRVVNREVEGGGDARLPLQGRLITGLVLSGWVAAVLFLLVKRLTETMSFCECSGRAIHGATWR